MANDTQRIYLGSQATPVLWTNLGSGAITLNFDGEEIIVNFNYTEEQILSVFEGAASIGSGNVAITKETDAILAVFIGTLANADQPEITVVSNTLKQSADTISVVVDQAGIAPVDCVPSIATITTAVAATNEVQTIDDGGGVGDFDLNGNSTSATITLLGTGSGVDTALIQTGCDAIWGSGKTTVTDTGGASPYYIEFIDTLAATNIPQMTITNDATDGSGVTSGTATEGASSVSQVDEVTFDSVAVGGTMTIDGDNCDWDQDASIALTITGATVSATTPASGSIEITWDDDQPHTPVEVTTGTLKSVIGQPDITTITLDDSPEEGKFYLYTGVLSLLNNFDTTANSLEVNIEAIFSIPCSVTHPESNSWVIESDENIAPIEWTADEDNEAPLRKACGAEIVTVQEGSAEGGDSGSAFPFLFNGGILG